MYKITMMLNDKQKEAFDRIHETNETMFDLENKGVIRCEKISLYPTKSQRDLDVHDKLVFCHQKENGVLTGRTIAVLHVGDRRYVGIYDADQENEEVVTRKGKKVKRVMSRRVNRHASIGRAFLAFAIDLGMAHPRANEFAFGFNANYVTDDVKKLVPEWMWEKKEETVEEETTQPTAGTNLDSYGSLDGYGQCF